MSNQNNDFPNPNSDANNSFEADVKILPPDETSEEQRKIIEASVSDYGNPSSSTHNNYTEPEKTDRTKADYIEKASRILKKAARDSGSNSLRGDGLVTSIAHLIAQKDQYTKATWRYYKAAIIYYIESEIGEDDEDAGMAMAMLFQTNTESCKRAFTGQSSSKKRKSIPKEDLEKLIEAAKKSRKKSDGDDALASQAVDWLIASTVVGLRPVEWNLVSIDPSEHPEMSNPRRQHRLKFVVKNAKNTNGRAHGDFRQFTVSTDERTKNIIMRVHERCVKLNETDFGIYLKACRQALRRLCKKLWPRAETKNYTLYTGRHQFSANQKSSGKSKKEVSYLMGHKVTKTAIMSYGKRRSGWPQTPDADDISPDEQNFELKIEDNAKVFEPSNRPSGPSISGPASSNN